MACCLGQHVHAEASFCAVYRLRALRPLGVVQLYTGWSASAARAGPGIWLHDDVCWRHACGGVLSLPADTPIELGASRRTGLRRLSWCASNCWRICGWTGPAAVWARRICAACGTAAVSWTSASASSHATRSLNSCGQSTALRCRSANDVTTIPSLLA